MTQRSRRPLAILGAVALVATLGAVLAPAQAHHAQPPGPIHAGSEFGWGGAPIDYAFVTPLKRSHWRVKGPGLVRNQNGMLTLNTAEHGTVSATQRTKGHAVGRWEIRLRSLQYQHGHRSYRVLTELVPAGKRAQHCGAQNIALEAYIPHGRTVGHYIHNRPDRSYTAHQAITLRNDQWHTFAVEVTRTRISWFVDAHVVSTEKRKGALSGVPFAVRFTMQAQDGKRMNRARMQMDWLRYWTLEKHNKKSTAARAPSAGTYRGGCGGR